MLSRLYRIGGLGLSLEKLYKVFPWPENPGENYFYERLRLGLGVVSKALEHEFLAGMLKSRDLVRVVDVCSGTGIGAYLFAKLLLEKGYRVRLTLVDIRSAALLKGSRWIARELGVEPETIVMDAAKLHTLGKRFDLAVMWGSSAPHFNPWSMNKLLAAVSESLEDNGVFVMQESDRFYRIVEGGYHRVNVVEGEDKSVLDVYVGYNHLMGTAKRLVVNLQDPSMSTYMDLYYWSIASLGALLWLFFEDVDVMEGWTKPIYLLLASKPRRAITPSHLRRSPRALLGNTCSPNRCL